MNTREWMTKSLPDVLSKTIRVYDEVASKYAETWFDDPVMEPALEEFLQHLELPGEVLDVGCGPGRDVLPWQREVSRLWA